MKVMKNKMAFGSWGYVAGLLFLFALAPVRAAQALLPPQEVIQTASDKLQIQLQDKTFIEDFARVNRYVEEVIDPYMDFDRISMYVLGNLWRQASPEQKAQFKKEFRELLIRTYSRAFTEFKDWKIRYLPLRVDENDNKVVVRTEIHQPGKQPVAVHYRMINVKGTWKVYDIIIEGVSLVTNYRTSFKSEVERTGSLDSVIHRIASRNTKALRGDGGSDDELKEGS